MITAQATLTNDMSTVSFRIGLINREIQAVMAVALLMMIVLSVLDFLLRLFNAGIEGSSVYVQNLCLWVGFLGALIASGEKRHITLMNLASFMPARIQNLAEVLANGVSAAVTTGIFCAAWQFVRAEMGSPVRISGWLPQWTPEAVLPVVFGLMTLRWMDQTPGRVSRIFVSAGWLAAGGIGIAFSPYMPLLLWPMVAVVGASGVYEGWRSARENTSVSPREFVKSVWVSKWDIALPVLILVGIFGGYCTLLEGAAASVLFALVIETVIYRSLGPRKDQPRIFLKCASLIGGVFAILGVSMGLTNYMVDAEYAVLFELGSSTGTHRMAMEHSTHAP